MRPLIVFDGNAWFVRRVQSTTHDLEHDHQVYRCDKPLGGPYVQFELAAMFIDVLIRRGDVFHEDDEPAAKREPTSRSKDEENATIQHAASILNAIARCPPILRTEVLARVSKVLVEAEERIPDRFK